MILERKAIVLGVCGGIAAYKAAALCSQLVRAGAVVDVIMTDAAREFVAPLTFQALTHRPVATDMFSLFTETEIGHVSLAKRADLLIIAPATANTLAKMASGQADNMLTTTALATEAPILLAPAMESRMWTHPLTQDNLARLQDVCDLVVVGPAEGRLASGAYGLGRMAEPDLILDAVRWVLGRNGPLAGMRVVVTAGGTRESLDPIRFIGNRSSGQMGYTLAHEARDRGAHVILISTTAQLAPFGVELVPVDTAIEMRRAVVEALPDASVLLMAAAVADYEPAVRSDHKIKKVESGLTIDLTRTPDILAQVAELRTPRQLIVGFAAETENLLENAAAKLQRKRLDLIVANDARQAMGSATNQVTLLFADGRIEEFPVLPKEEVACRILDRVMTLSGRGERQKTS